MIATGTAVTAASEMNAARAGRVGTTTKNSGIHSATQDSPMKPAAPSRPDPKNSANAIP
jgi:hypothetical protein